MKLKLFNKRNSDKNLYILCMNRHNNNNTHLMS